ncbi:MAG: DUF1822 family protein [Hydrococcus sp. C42_A2020_068]|nr:DUF1822 family protein [Hydrococcus sp. C42_A2020_068]
MIESILSQSLTIPFTQDESKLAIQFAQQQPTKEKQKQVYLNTLAVLAVNRYLEMLEISTDLQSSYSWNPIIRLCADVADLKVTDLNLKKFGHLECRPVLTGQEFAWIPPDAWEERIGYIFVRLDTECHQGALLGFLPTVSKEKIPIACLQSLDEFLDFLYKPTLNFVCLSDWFDNIFTTGWEAIEEVIVNHQQANPALAFRLGRVRFDKMEWLRQQIKQLFPTGKPSSPILPPRDRDPIPALVQILQATQDEETRWQAAEMLWEIEPTHPAAGVRRIIDLGMQLGGHRVALMVALLEKPDQKVAVLLRVYPMGNRDTLPPLLQLSVYESDNPVAQVQARSQPLDNYIQLKLIAENGEKFSVKVALEETSFIEYFII